MKDVSIVKTHKQKENKSNFSKFPKKLNFFFEISKPTLHEECRIFHKNKKKIRKLPFQRQSKIISLNFIIQHLKTVTFFSSSLVQRKLSLGYATLYRGNTRVNQHYNKDSLNPNTRITTILYLREPFHICNTPGSRISDRCDIRFNIFLSYYYG